MSQTTKSFSFARCFIYVWSFFKFSECSFSVAVSKSRSSSLLLPIVCRKAPVWGLYCFCCSLFNTFWLLLKTFLIIATQMAYSFVSHLSSSHTSYIHALTLLKTVMQILFPLATFAKPLIRKLGVTAVTAFTLLAKLCYTLNWVMLFMPSFHCNWIARILNDSSLLLPPAVLQF